MAKLICRMPIPSLNVLPYSPRKYNYYVYCRSLSNESTDQRPWIVAKYQFWIGFDPVWLYNYT